MRSLTHDYSPPLTVRETNYLSPEGGIFFFPRENNEISRYFPYEGNQGK